MKIDYIVADPTGNITVLIKTVPTEENRLDMIHKAFELEPSCEQVGFISGISDHCAKLEMMGYEFCGNATLSTACWLAASNKLPVGSRDSFEIISSGMEEPVNVDVLRLEPENNEDGSISPAFSATLNVAAPAMEIFEDFPLMHLDGISHLIVPETEMDPGRAQGKIKKYASNFDVPAFGIILCDKKSNSELSIKPLVYVKGSDTLVWEQGCASGSTAIGYYLHTLSGVESVSIEQPGGTMRLDIKDEDLFLTGKVILNM